MEILTRFRFIVRQEHDIWVAICADRYIVGQGSTAEEAANNLALIIEAQAGLMLAKQLPETPERVLEGERFYPGELHLKVERYP